MRKPDVDFRALDSVLVRHFGPRDSFTYERTEIGTSTQVYRLRRGADTFYVRIAETAADSFAPEVEAHHALLRAGVRVPPITWYEPFVDALERSVMATGAVPGTSIEDLATAADIPAIARGAGHDLALVHAIPVHGFGWVSREHGEPGWPLRADIRTYAEFIDPPRVGKALAGIGFEPGDVASVEDLLTEAVRLGPPGDTGYLAHGDFDTTHIFGRAGAYTGLIDFGEIRGADYTFDFATLMLNTDQPWRAAAYPEVERAYAEIRPLADDHARRLYVACAHSAAHRLAHWYERDGRAATTHTFFRAIRGRLAELLRSGEVCRGPPTRMTAPSPTCRITNRPAVESGPEPGAACPCAMRWQVRHHCRGTLCSPRTTTTPCPCAPVP